ncbi:hypothetical protein D3C71_1737600 [compost metagenome]
MFLATFTLGENDRPDLNSLLSDGMVELPPVGIGAQPARPATAAIRHADSRRGLRRDGLCCCGFMFVSLRDKPFAGEDSVSGGRARCALTSCLRKSDIFTGKRGHIPANEM